MLHMLKGNECHHFAKAYDCKQIESPATAKGCYEVSLGSRQHRGTQLGRAITRFPGIQLGASESV